MKDLCRNLYAGFLVLALLLLCGERSAAGNLPADVLSKLNGYNVNWTTPSTNGSPGSMPIGNGDLTANVWVENGGDLMLYLGKSDSWSEATRLLKIGRTRLHFTPNPFAAGAPFSETLDLYHGEIDITAGQPGAQINLRVWIDANQPVARIEASGAQNFTWSCSNEVWRSSTYTLPSANDAAAPSFRGVTGGPTMPSESADTVVPLANELLWYHRNASSFFQTILGGENLSNAWANFPDPYLNRTFGAVIKGDGFSTVNNYTLQSGAGTNFLLSIYPCTAQTGTAALWEQQLSNQVAQVDAMDIETARTNHYQWWDAFWNRSWIFASGDTNATNVTRGYLLQRFMEACQGRGNYPMKFNGGTFTFDYNGQNGDYRTWGPAYWHQNTRHMYWPLLASGDFDMMQPFFNTYTNMLALQTAATTKYYAHGGAFFPETFNIFGLYIMDDWGWGRSNQVDTSNTYIKYHYQGALETLGMMLSYYDYTRDGAFATNYIVPFAAQAIRFFAQHWPQVNGVIKFYPANALEMYWSCTNSADYIAGLRDDIPKLMALPANYTTPALVAEWRKCLGSLPPLPMDAGGTRVLPAQTYGAANNSENPECYCIFPYRIYGLGRSNFNVGLNTFVNRVVQNNKKCWSQDVIEEPLVGLTAQAQADVILNFTDTDSQCRFPAFWTSNHDYLPDLDNGGAAMTGLQFMLLQCNSNQITPLPAWPATWNVDFKLCAPSNTTVRLILQNGVVSQLSTTPAFRTSDLVTATAPPPTGVTASAGNTQIGLNWAGSAGASGYNIKRSSVSGANYSVVASNVTATGYIDTGLTNGTNYFYVVSAINLWGESVNSAEVIVAPGTGIPARVEGDLIVNLQSADLNANGKVWTNRTHNVNGAGNFSTIGGGNLNVAGLNWNGQTMKTLFVNGSGNNSVQSAVMTPAEIIGNHAVSAEVWAYATSVTPSSCVLNFGKQGGSSFPLEDREFNYETGGFGAFSGFYGNADTGWASVTTGTWHYLAYSFDGTAVKVYQDGVLNGSLTGITLSTVPSFMQVGSDISGTNVNGGNDAFRGYIAAARVESGVLTAADVAANYVLGPVAGVTPASPTALKAVAGDGQVLVQWNAAAGATGYYLKRALVSAGPFAAIASNVVVTNFTDSRVTNGVSYYYVVSATNLLGESADSAAVVGQPVSLARPQLNVGINGGQMQFAWPQNHLGWRLQAQSNGLGTNWVTITASQNVSAMALPIDPSGRGMFFRLVYP